MQDANRGIAMSVDNKAIVIRHLEMAWNRNDLATLEECISPEAVIYCRWLRESA